MCQSDNIRVCTCTRVCVSPPNLKQVPGIGACCVFCQSDKTFCVVIVSQPEKGWDSVGGKPQEGALVTAIAEKLKALGLARFEIPTKVGVDDPWILPNP